jgi:PAS domain S-box-containing protein
MENENEAQISPSQELDQLRKEIAELKERELKYKNIARTLSISDQRYRRLFETSQDIFYVCTPGGKLIYINPGGLELLRYQPEEDSQSIKNIENFYQNPRNLERYLTLMETQGYVRDFEVILKRNDGRFIFALVNSISMKGKTDGSMEYIGIIRDDTERIKNERLLKKMMVELMVTNQKLEQIKTQASQSEQGRMAAVMQLLGSIAHELDNSIEFMESNFKIMTNYMKVIENYIKSLEYLANHIQDYDETMHLVNEIQKVKDLKQRENIEYILKDTKELFESTLKGAGKITNIANNLRRI